MLNGHIPGMTDATAGCTISKTGFCKDCPKFRSMPFDVRNPVTGEIIKSGTVFDCVDVWAMMGSWDAGNQTMRVHAAVADHRNEAVKAQHEALELLKFDSRATRQHEQAVQREIRVQNKFLDDIGRLAQEARVEDKRAKRRLADAPEGD